MLLWLIVYHSCDFGVVLVCLLFVSAVTLGSTAPCTSHAPGCPETAVSSNSLPLHHNMYWILLPCGLYLTLSSGWRIYESLKDDEDAKSNGAQHQFLVRITNICTTRKSNIPLTTSREVANHTSQFASYLIAPVNGNIAFCYLCWVLLCGNYDDNYAR